MKKINEKNKIKENIQKKSKAIKKVDFLSLLSKSRNKRKRAQLLDFAGKDEIDAIAECIYNVLKGRVPIEEKKLKRLKFYKNVMRLMIDKRIPMREKKENLKQKGGFLSLLIPPALSLLGSAVPELIKLIIPQRK